MKNKPALFGQKYSSRDYTKAECWEIILGGGQDLLSPERRFDAVLVNSPDIFD